MRSCIQKLLHYSHISLITGMAKARRRRMRRKRRRRRWS
jgi:hypothetical protein